MDEYTHKAEFVKGLGELLHNHSRIGVNTLKYLSKDDPDFFAGVSQYKTSSISEVVKVVYENGYIKYIDVTADSVLGILRDIGRCID